MTRHDRSTRQTRLHTLALAFAVVATACGGGGSGPDAGSGTTPPPSSTPSPSPSPSPSTNGWRAARVDADYDGNGVYDAREIYEYDTQGRLTRLTYTYTDDGVSDITRRRSNVDSVETYAYTDDRLTTLTVESADGTRSAITYQYDAAGDATRADVQFTSAGGSGSLAYTYTHANGRLSSATQSLLGQTTQTETFSYDTNGLPSSVLTVASGGGRTRTAYAWFAADRIQTVAIGPDGAAPTETTTFTNDANNRVLGALTTRSNGTSVRYTHIYDTAGRPAEVTIDVSNNGSVDGRDVVTLEQGPCTPVRLPGVSAVVPRDGYNASSSARYSLCAP